MLSVILELRSDVAVGDSLREKDEVIHVLEKVVLETVPQLCIGCHIHPLVVVLVFRGCLKKRQYVIVPSFSLATVPSFCSSCIVRARVPSYASSCPPVGTVACDSSCVVPFPFEIYVRPFLHVHVLGNIYGSACAPAYEIHPGLQAIITGIVVSVARSRVVLVSGVGGCAVGMGRCVIVSLSGSSPRHAHDQTNHLPLCPPQREEHVLGESP